MTYLSINSQDWPWCSYLLKIPDQIKSLFRRGSCLFLTGLLFYLFIVPGISQTGIPYYSNFRLPEGMSKQNRSLVQDSLGNLLFANNHGLLRFDGLHWEYMLQDVIPYTLASDPQTGEIYISTETGFGLLEETPKGDYTYHQLYEIGENLDPAISISFQKEMVIFYSNQGIYKYYQTSGTTEELWPEPGTLFAGYFLFRDQLYVNIKGKGIFLSRNNRLTPFPEGDIFDNVSILFYLEISEYQCVLVTDNSLIYKFNGHDFNDFIPQDDEYLSKAVIKEGLSISESEIVFGTLSGGCLFLNINTGQTEFTLNYQSGLPDDEIYAMYQDHDRGIWLTHEFGATRIDPNLPVRTFNPLKGLEGNLSEAFLFRNKLYVSTSEGVYFLHKAKHYKETKIWVTQPVNMAPIPSSLEKPVKDQLLQHGSVSNFSTSPPEEKKGILSRIFKPKKNKNKSISEPEALKTVTLPPPVSGPLKVEENHPSPKPTTRFQLKRQAQLISESWEFSKVKGLNAKCSQMLAYKNRLFVASNTGLYEITEKGSRSIINYAYVNQLLLSSSIPGRMYVGTGSGLETVDFNHNTYHVNHNFLTLDRPVFSILEDGENLWLGSESRAILVSLDSNGEAGKSEFFPLPVHYSEKVIVERLKNQVGFFIPSGVFTVRDNTRELMAVDSLRPVNGRLNQYLFTGKEGVFLKSGNEWKDLSSDKSTGSISPFLNLFNDIRFLRYGPDKNLWVIDGDNYLNKILLDKQHFVTNHFYLHILSFKGSKNDFTGEKSITIYSGDQPLVLELSAPFFIRPDLTEYQYTLTGLNPDRSRWSVNPLINLPFLAAGNYELKIRARNALNIDSVEKSLKINVLPPFTDSGYFYVLMVLGILSIIALVVVIRERKLMHDKKVLEQKVQTRTREIEKQKEQIENQKDKIEKQRDEIALRQQEITDSIDYGKRIQCAVLPPESTLDKLLKDYFIFYRPRDIVSGDFYWVYEKNGKMVIAIADCTGHGVPGAFMSFLGSSILTEIGNNDSLTSAGKILDHLRLKLKVALHQTRDNQETEDGMDMALCILDLKRATCQFAGAYNPLCIVRDRKFKEIPGDKMPIGMHLMDHIAFTNHKINLKKDDQLYLYTDGYADQFGGPKMKKFKIGPFHDLLLQISDLSIKDQENILDEKLRDWMGDAEQVDDILIMGIKIG